MVSYGGVLMSFECLASFSNASHHSNVLVNRRRNNENHLLARAPVLSNLHRVGVEHSPGQKASRGQLDGVVRPRAAEDQVEIPRHLEEVLEIGHHVGEVDAAVRGPQLNEEEVEDLHGEVVDLLRLAGWDEGEEVVDLLRAQAVVLCYVGCVGHGRCGGMLVHRVWIGGTDVGIPLMPSNCLIFFMPQKPAQKSEYRAKMLVCMKLQIHALKSRPRVVLSPRRGPG